jgi:hypothetical protein
MLLCRAGFKGDVQVPWCAGARWPALADSELTANPRRDFRHRLAAALSSVTALFELFAPAARARIVAGSFARSRRQLRQQTLRFEFGLGHVMASVKQSHSQDASARRPGD